MHNYKQLEIWKKSKSLCVEIYSATASFPITETYSLTSQIRRCAISIPSNIAEGCSRKSAKDLARFLEIAIGSAFELETQLMISFELNYIDKENFEYLQSKLTSVFQMTIKFKNSLIY